MEGVVGVLGSTLVSFVGVVAVDDGKDLGAGESSGSNCNAAGVGVVGDKTWDSSDFRLDDWVSVEGVSISSFFDLEPDFL